MPEEKEEEVDLLRRLSTEDLLKRLVRFCSRAHPKNASVNPWVLRIREILAERGIDPDVPKLVLEHINGSDTKRSRSSLTG